MTYYDFLAFDDRSQFSRIFLVSQKLTQMLRPNFPGSMNWAWLPLRHRSKASGQEPGQTAQSWHGRRSQLGDETGIWYVLMQYVCLVLSNHIDVY